MLIFFSQRLPGFKASKVSIVSIHANGKHISPERQSIISCCCFSYGWWVFPVQALLATCRCGSKVDCILLIATVPFH